MSSPRVTTVPLPPAKGRSIDGDLRHLTSRGMPRELRRRNETGENSRPTNGEDTTPAHSTPNNYAIRFTRGTVFAATLVRYCYGLLAGPLYAIVTDDTALAVFELIRRKRHCATVVLCAVDLLELDGEDLRRAPISCGRRSYNGARECPLRGF